MKVTTIIMLHCWGHPAGVVRLDSRHGQPLRGGIAATGLPLAGAEGEDADGIWGKLGAVGLNGHALKGAGKTRAQSTMAYRARGSK